MTISKGKPFWKLYVTPPASLVAGLGADVVKAQRWSSAGEVWTRPGLCLCYWGHGGRGDSDEGAVRWETITQAQMC